MTTTKQITAARRNIVKAQTAWKNMTHGQRALAQPQGRSRAKPGTGGGGTYYRIVVRPRREFVSFRTHDIGKPGELLRITGRRSSGSWATQAWLIDKRMAHVEGEYLVADAPDAVRLLMTLRSVPFHEKGDIFTAEDRRNVPEKEKPTLAQQAARMKNIHKAQAAWRAMHNKA
jgi:hypothetical protein